MLASLSLPLLLRPAPFFHDRCSFNFLYLSFLAIEPTFSFSVSLSPPPLAFHQNSVCPFVSSKVTINISRNILVPSVKNMILAI